MVLSNKKLKQKLREEIAKISIKNNSESNPTTNQETPKLLDSETPKPRLSKREKRRKSLNLKSPEVGNGENGENKVAHVEETEEIGKGKKRKREKKVEKNGGVDEELGVKEEGSEVKTEGKVSKKKKKKKKKHKKKGKSEKQGNQSVVEGNGAVAEHSVAEDMVTEQIVAENNDYSNSYENAEDNKKIYVGGIPFYSTEDDIRSYFDHCGTITDIDCMKFPESGKFRGIAIISFKTEQAAKRGLALDGSDMGGLYLKIQPYKATRPTRPTTTDFSPPVLAGYNRIYAGNLSWEITEDDLRSFFSNCNISAIRFGEDKETGEFKGYAHVDFADNASLTKALQLDQMVVCGRPVRIRCAVPPKKGGAIINPGSVSTVMPTVVPTVIPTVSKAEAENSKVEAVIENGNVEAVIENSKAETENKSTVSAGKLKRRTCYECGQRGHISSDCPNKQGTEETNPSAS